MLYTSVPLERVYADLREKKQEEQVKKDYENAEYKEVLLKHGRVVARRNGEDYVVQRINSTDMTDYLNDEYSPGRTIKDISTDRQ